MNKKAIINKSDIQEDKEKVSISLNTDITSKGYASITGQSLFVGQFGRYIFV